MIEIGPYRISHYKGLEGGFWIAGEGGEGMQVKEQALVDLIGKFYKENF